MKNRRPAPIDSIDFRIFCVLFLESYSLNKTSMTSLTKKQNETTRKTQNEKYG